MWGGAIVEMGCVYGSTWGSLEDQAEFYISQCFCSSLDI